MHLFSSYPMTPLDDEIFYWSCLISNGDTKHITIRNNF